MIINIPQIRPHLEKLSSLEEQIILFRIKALASKYGNDLVREALLEAIAIYSDPTTARNPYLIGGTPLDNEIKKLSSAILRRKTYKWH